LSTSRRPSTFTNNTKKSNKQLSSAKKKNSPLVSSRSSPSLLPVWTTALCVEPTSETPERYSNFISEIKGKYEQEDAWALVSSLLPVPFFSASPPLLTTALTVKTRNRGGRRLLESVIGCIDQVVGYVDAGGP